MIIEMTHPAWKQYEISITVNIQVCPYRIAASLLFSLYSDCVVVTPNFRRLRASTRCAVSLPFSSYSRGKRGLPLLLQRSSTSVDEGVTPAVFVRVGGVNLNWKH